MYAHTGWVNIVRVLPFIVQIKSEKEEKEIIKK